MKNACWRRTWRVGSKLIVAEFALVTGPEQVKGVLDALQAFLEGVQSNGVREWVYRIAGRLGDTGGKHPLFKSMMVQSKRLMKSRKQSERMQSIAVYRIFAKSLPLEESMGYLFRYLADSDQDVLR
jgi:hypothetical protein